MANMLEGGGKTPISQAGGAGAARVQAGGLPALLVGRVHPRHAVRPTAAQGAQPLRLHSLRCIINAWQSACSTHMLKEKDVLELHTAPTVALRRYKAYWLACCPTLGIATPRYKVSDPVKPDIRTMRKS